MKKSKNATILAIALLMSLTIPCAGAAQAAPARTEVIAAARDIMQTARYATLVSIGADGHPQARVIDPFVPEADFTIWVGTNRQTRKVGEIRANPRVTLLYFNADAGEFVTLIGTATLVDDAASKARHWKDEWVAFYPNGRTDESYMLIRIHPIRLEVVSPARGILNDVKTWRPVTIDLP
jgi:general stress protein 26